MTEILRKFLCVIAIGLAPMSTSLAREQSGLRNVNIDDFFGGAPNDDTSDAIPALKRAAKAFAGTQGGTVHLACDKTYAFLTPINMAYDYPGVVVEGCLEAPDDSSVALGSRSVHVEFYQRGKVNFGPQFQAIIGASSGFRNVLFTQAGARFPNRTAAAYAGVPLKTATGGAGNYAILHHVMVVGAEQCLDARSGGGRLDIRDFRCDGLSGEAIGPSLDTTVLRDVHNFPYGTAASPNADNTRPGTGMELALGPCDDTRVEGYLDFGHRNGFLSRCNGNVWLGGRMWLDNNSGTAFNIKASTHMQGPGALAAASCGTCVQISDQTDIQVGSVLVSSAAGDCVKVDGTFVASSMIVGDCRGNGISLTARSEFATPFLRTTRISGTHICAGAGMATNQIYVGQSVSDLKFGTPLIGCHDTGLPALPSSNTLELPTSGTATPLSLAITGDEAIREIVGGWGGREIILELESHSRVISTDRIRLKGASAYVEGPSVLAFRLGPDAVWRQEW